MSRFVLILMLLMLYGCNTQPVYVDPRSAPILLRPGMTAQTLEPDRYVCATRAALVCERVGRARSLAECECLH